jgi:hypothetical protein
VKEGEGELKADQVCGVVAVVDLLVSFFALVRTKSWSRRFGRSGPPATMWRSGDCLLNHFSLVESAREFSKKQEEGDYSGVKEGGGDRRNSKIIAIVLPGEENQSACGGRMSG